MRLKYPDVRIENKEDVGFLAAQIIWYTLLPILFTILAMKIHWIFWFLITITLFMRLKNE